MAKTTKVEMFNAIKEIVKGNAEMVEFIDHEIELVQKKNSRKSNTPTPKQKENIVILDEIKTVLANAEQGLSVTEIAIVLNVDRETPLSNQRVSALLKKLVDGGVAEKVYDKRVAKFSLVE